ncbi:uncharacterized protein TrAtP1_004615 [Trichoderma atroviride]|uniref:TM7S3/TM198-like domain-containing protein n=1 Tax=Hypocrea atroviridis (strain ATCC 20476 / IMI 206040) TaxID=452589 RepID=G9P4P0_HYPAI|nr:uncharacterized protein TRIATDRAFT_321432 [Trichoderma atroviride IMI 206040]EHK41186.1 hypothetical protein TRIATDRAFT_321432 [Trichoderma atroviride IMI 206040]UKZ63383.1 hypothetical protein TrAtP1_004615 [Trichoderma atroviride]
MFKAMRLQALVCLLLALQVAATHDLHPLRRDGAASISSSEPRSQPTPQPSIARDQHQDSKQTDVSKESTTTKAPHSTTTSSTPTLQTTATVPSQTPLSNSTLFNATIPTGQLPIKPVLTPGWGVAGAVLLLTGALYTIIGLRNQWINCFFSTAYLTSLGITVLVVYLMNVPVSLAVQGAYVVAVVLSGCVLGAASLIFKELTEGLGCALGGFSFSMWLLCLAPGGLLHDTLGRAIFISCLSVGGFALSFSSYTRDWAMIILMSFGGATVIVLGIDCFSRAGLKEFWAYIWNLNGDLFPLGADTYPITRGIRVELAVIVVICFVGIVCQMRLWRIVRDRRNTKALKLAEDQRCLQQEEENVGRHIGQQTARERVAWEKVYGGRFMPDSNGMSTASHYSSGTDSGSNSKRQQRVHSESVYTESKTDGIEMTELSDSSVVQAGTDGLMSMGPAKEGKIMVRVAADEILETRKHREGEITEEQFGAMSESGAEIVDNDRRTGAAKEKEISQTSSEGRRNSPQRNMTPAPEVVPLPFKTPTEDDLKSIGDRSSVATFADDEPFASATPIRNSLVKRVSQSSATLLRSLSQQRKKSTSPERQLETGESTEDLVEPAESIHDDSRSSLAATVDYESLSDYQNEHDSIVDDDDRKSIEITAELGEAKAKATQSPEEVELETAAADDAEKSEGIEPQAMSKEIPGGETLEMESEPNEKRDGDELLDKQDSGAKAENAAGEEETSVTHEQEHTATAGSTTEGKLPESTDKTKSGSSATSVPANLTKDRLPTSMSRAALSYRTNEWAKHLGHADTPEPDAIHIEPYGSEVDMEEVPRYVDLEDLQMNIADRTSYVPPQQSDSGSTQVSSIQPNAKAVKKQARISEIVVSPAMSADAMSPSGSPKSPPMDMAGLQPAPVALRRISSGFAPIVEEQDGIQATELSPEDHSQQDATQLNPAPFRPIVPRVVSFSNPHTLLGQRESVLRSRSQGNLVAHLADYNIDAQGSVGDADSLYNYPVNHRVASPDPDDIPLSQRREIIRQSSRTNLPASNYLPLSNYRLNRSSSGIEVSGNTQFNSHQPKRISSVSVIAQNSRLANFRHSIARDLTSMTPGVPPNLGRETPFAPSSTLVDDMDTQRIVMMEKREAEIQRKEMQRREKEWNDRMFDARMRSGDLLDAHREVIRKMQSSAKDA